MHGCLLMCFLARLFFFFPSPFRCKKGTTCLSNSNSVVLTYLLLGQNPNPITSQKRKSMMMRRVHHQKAWDCIIWSSKSNKFSGLIWPPKEALPCSKRKAKLRTWVLVHPGWLAVRPTPYGTFHIFSTHFQSAECPLKLEQNLPFVEDRNLIRKKDPSFRFCKVHELWKPL